MRSYTWLRGAVVGATLCAVIGMSSCQATSLGVGREEGVYQRSHAIFQDQTCVRTDVYEVVQTNTPVEFCTRIGLKSGMLDWRILGPDGQNAQGTGDATSGEAYHIHYCVGVTPGDWELVLDMTEASGEYEIAWYEVESAPFAATHLPELIDYRDQISGLAR